MEHKLRKFSTHELLPVAHELIQSGKKVIISVSGNSMRPFIVGDRDKVLLGKARALKKGDVILFRNKQGDYILHRIYSIKKGKCKTIGDYCLKADGQVDTADVIGVVEAVIRKGRKIPCDSILWRLYSKVWLMLIPVRKQLIAGHKAYLKAKTGIKQTVSCLYGACQSCLLRIGMVIKRGRGENIK